LTPSPSVPRSQPAERHAGILFRKRQSDTVIGDKGKPVVVFKRAGSGISTDR
jgi:hypothetical protein